MNSITKRSLKTNFLLSLSVGAVALTMLGVLATYHIASDQLHEQLVQRGRLLASAINHSAMIVSNEADLAHVANEVMRDNSEITGLLILAQDGQHTIFQKLSMVTDEISGNVPAPAAGRRSCDGHRNFRYSST